VPHRFQIRSRYDLGAADTAGAVELINTEPAQLPGIVQRLDANPEVAVE
jgi:hypothetical protein